MDEVNPVPHAAGLNGGPLPIRRNAPPRDPPENGNMQDIAIRRVEDDEGPNNLSRNQAGAEEAVGQIIRNHPPRGRRLDPIPAEVRHRLPRADRVYPAAMFHPEYNNSVANVAPYIRDEADTPSPNDSPGERQRKSRRHQHHNEGKTKSIISPPDPGMRSLSQPKFGFSTPTILIAVQIIIIFLFGVFVSYDQEVTAIPKIPKPSPQQLGQEESSKIEKSIRGEFLEKHSSDNIRLHKFYPLFQDVHVMIFIGFGFLMTFLRKYAYSAVGYNLLIASLAIQWSILCRGIFHHGDNTIPINIQTLINGDFSAGAVLISFGAVLGVTSPLHLLTMALIEVLLYSVNEYIGSELFGAVDIGGSLWIHTFGAYFGLSLSLVLRRQQDIDTSKEGSSYNSDIFAMIGTIFLWLFWPSFNGAMALGDDQHRAVLNTVLSLCASCVFSFAASSLMCPENKFNMVHVQNASLAGGVAVGAIADLMIQPFGALVIGASAGLLSTAGYVYLSPFLQQKLGLHDTCGVHNLHGMPGVMAGKRSAFYRDAFCVYILVMYTLGLVAVIMAAVADENMYGKSLYLQYPARAPVEDSLAFTEAKDDLTSIEPGVGRTAQQQALFQLAALGTTLGIALTGGAITGLVLRIPCFGKVSSEALFDDSSHWEVPNDSESSGGFQGNKEAPTSLEME